MANGRLLDVGCGDKPHADVLAPHISAHVGVEFTPTFEGSVSARSVRADVVYSGDRLPFRDGEFDTVLSNQVLEHVTDPHALFAEMIRVLRPGGRTIVTVPFSFRIHSAPTDYHRFTRYALEHMCETHHLTVEVLEPRGGLWRVIGHKITTYLAFRVARLDAVLQAAGGMTYEGTARARPRYWTLPLVAPTVLATATVSRILDRLDRQDDDTLGYVLVARRPDALAGRHGSPS